MFERGLPYLKKAPRLACARDACPVENRRFRLPRLPHKDHSSRRSTEDIAAEICKTAAAAATGFSRRVYYEAGKRNELPSAAG